MPGTAIDDFALASRNNPVLFLFPEDSVRSHPGAGNANKHGYGDYHPKDVQVFLDHSVTWTRTVPYLPRALQTGFRLPPGEMRKRLLTPEGRRESRDWELDLPNVRALLDRKTWSEYHQILTAEQPKTVVYVRICRNELNQRTAIQYWYFYWYNDHTNNHEGDWECVTIELDETEEPTRIVCSAHDHENCAAWSAAPRATPDNRPLVFVARGSHAGYLSYRPDGHPNEPKTSLQRTATHASDAVRAAASWLFLRGRFQRAPFRRTTRDWPPADFDAERDSGVPVSPKICLFPPDSEFSGRDDYWWWLSFNGFWGSRKLRSIPGGFAGPRSPWARDAWKSAGGPLAPDRHQQPNPRERRPPGRKQHDA